MDRCCKDEHGISLIVLIITIIVVIILSTITIMVGTGALDITADAEDANLKKEIVDAISVRFSEYSKNDTLYPLLGDEISGLNNEVLSMIQVNNIVTDYLTNANIDVPTDISSVCGASEKEAKYAKYIRVLDEHDIATLGIENVRSGTKLLVNYFTVSVIRLDT